jgi:hypothetical protein
MQSVFDPHLNFRATRRTEDIADDIEGADDDVARDASCMLPVIVATFGCMMLVL